MKGHRFSARFVRILYLIVTLSTLVSLTLWCIDVAMDNRKLRGLRKDLRRVIRQRNLLSNSLNEFKKEVGQEVCRNQKFISKDPKAYDACQNPYIYAQREVFDVHFAMALGKFLNHQKVASFGEGSGEIKTYLEGQKSVASYDGFDPAPFIEKFTNGTIRFLDLTVPQYDLPVYDWVVSMNIAEHVPSEFENIFVNNIARHARVGAIICWGQHWQYGINNLNVKSQNEVDTIMKREKFIVDTAETDRLRKEARRNWIRRSVRVFRRHPNFPLDIIDA